MARVCVPLSKTPKRPRRWVVDEGAAAAEEEPSAAATDEERPVEAAKGSLLFVARDDEGAVPALAARAVCGWVGLFAVVEEEEDISLSWI